MKMGSREHGYEIDNTTGPKTKSLPVVALIIFLAALAVWRLFL
jgi:hypothetical protein